MTNSYFIILLFIVYLLSLFGSIQYRKFAINHKILANLNIRTLHENPMPRGGGIVFSLVFIFSVLFLYLINVIKIELFLVFGVGAGFSAIIGYIDDVRGIGSMKKLLLQILLVLWILYIFNGGPLNMIESLNGWPSWVISIFFLVWLINVYNFIELLHQ